MNADQTERLVSQIVEAFSDAPRPQGDRTVLGGDPDAAEIQAFFKDKDWRDLDAGALAPQYMDVLPLLTPQAFRYFLPAYMIASVEAHDEADALPDFTAYSLTEPDAQDAFSEGPTVPAMSPQGFRDNASQFTAAQEEAVRAFLEHMVAAHGNDWAVAALARYWGLDEEVVFDQEGIVVSTARLTVPGRTYCLNRVDSARTRRKTPSRAWPIAFFLVGGAPLFQLGYIFGGDSAGGFVILMLFFVTLAWCLQARPRYSIVLDTSSGEAQALTSTDRELIERAVRAINDALSPQGGRPQETPPAETTLDNARLREYHAFDDDARPEARDARSESMQGEDPGPMDAGLPMAGDAAGHGPPVPSLQTLPDEEGQPCCAKCFEPFEPAQDYCRNCGWAVGSSPSTSYLDCRTLLPGNSRRRMNLPLRPTTKHNHAERLCCPREGRGQGAVWRDALLRVRSFAVWRDPAVIVDAPLCGIAVWRDTLPRVRAVAVIVAVPRLRDGADHSAKRDGGLVVRPSGRPFAPRSMGPPAQFRPHSDA